jgi:flagellar basal body-associated protein FliL
MASEKPAAAPAAPAAEEKAAPSKKGGMKMIIAAIAVVLLEVGTVAVTVKMSAGPKAAMAEHPATATATAAEKDAEVKLVADKLPNNQSGRLWMYDMQIVAKVSEKKKEKVTALLAERESEIRDRIRTIVASSDPKSLAEPGLETLRRQIAYQLEQDIGKELVKEVLIPKCTPIRAE